MTRLDWNALVGLGLAGVLAAAAPATASDEQAGGGATTTGSPSTQGQTGASGTSAPSEGEEEDAKKGTGARGSGMGGTSTGARPGEASGAGTPRGTTGSVDPAPDAHQNEITGRIQAYDRDRRTLTLADSDQKLTVGDDTIVIKNGERASPGDLMEGDEVRASFAEGGAQGDAVRVERLEVLSSGGTSERGGAKGTGMGGTSTGARPGEVTGAPEEEPASEPGTGIGKGKASGTPEPAGGSPDPSGTTK
ncbi:MAG TPA: hypothetical protein VD838_13645 [Anaeromyxobacteraceae bacterium]|nr:hypothetical protein [Anaeromyxobacteraceae bacterium]